MKISKYLLLSFLAGLFTLSCTKIEAPYVAAKHNNIKDTIIDWDTVTKVRKVLLEDYTGHKCVNCPEASIAAKALEDQNHGKLFVLAVHAGFYALPSSTGDYTLDLRTTTGEYWYNSFGVVANPTGMVNRKSFDGTLMLVPDKWGNSIAQIINTSPDAEMLMINSYDSTSGNLNSVIYSHFLKPMMGTFRITVCIVEDSIIGTQKNNNPALGPSPDWPNYSFDDVLRGSINGNDGEVLTTAVNDDLTYMGRFNITMNTAWVAKNCWLMAFISDASTREIIQVEKKRIIPISK